ncbi:MAG TPA: methyltransferase domain-containing protein [Sedimentisphaerales bacterium]|nr:methyltransferase domain-containing protein [Sedimentisphaerales bacterium]
MLFLQGFRNRDFQFLVKNIIESAHSVLDVGCGLGDYLEKYTNNSQRVVAVEPYLPYLREGQKKAPWAEFKNTDALTYFAQTDEKFDCVLLIDVVEHLEKEQAVQMVQRAIKHSRKTVFCQTPFGVHEQHRDLWNMGGDYWQTHRSVWDNTNLNELGFSFYTIWRNWYEWDESQGNKNRDATIAMWISDFSKENFTILLTIRACSLLSDVRKTLASIINQTYPKFELVIIKDTLSAKMNDLIQEYQKIDSRVRVAALHDPVDVSYLERKISEAKDGFLLVCECGDLLPANKLERQVKLLKHIEAVKAGDAEQIKLLGQDSYLEALRKDNFYKWKQAYKEGYNSTTGDHRRYFYNGYLEEIGFYRDVSRAKRVVEFAPGSGVFFEGFIRAGPQKQFFFVDISELNLQRLKARFSGYANVSYILNDRRQLPLDDIGSIFSFLLCQCMPKSLWIEHLQETCRMLNDGGSYVFQFASNPRLTANDSIWDSLSGSQVYTSDQMRALVGDAGFSQVVLTPPIDLAPLNPDTETVWYLCKAVK